MGRDDVAPNAAVDDALIDELERGSLHRFADRSPAGVALAHYGLVPDPINTLLEAEDTLLKWAEVAVFGGVKPERAEI